MTGPLAGLHVVEIANEISGPYATKLFVDLGAEVTKIEPPSGPERWRAGDSASRTCNSSTQSWCCSAYLRLVDQDRCVTGRPRH